MRRPALSVLLAVVLGASLLSCGSSGRDLRDPVDGAVSPTRAVSTTLPSVATIGGTAIVPLSLTSPAFANGDRIPADHSCKGPSPALQWTGVPVGTTELVLVVVDESDDGFVHWLITGIAPTTGSIAEGQAPTGAIQHANSAGGLGWYGPCPTGETPHSYVFTLMALTTPSNIAASIPAKDAVLALEEGLRTSGDRAAVLVGTFGGSTSGTTPGSGVAPTLGTSPGSTRR